jgi:prepilin-type processing-associated H-X9-DG protein
MGFTLTHLAVVILCVSLLAAFFIMIVPYILHTREMKNRYSCLAQLKGIGTALALYAQANNNTYPMLPGCGWDNVADGTNYLSNSGSPFTTAKPTGDWSKPRSVTSLMFMLIRNGEAPQLFICPSDTNATGDQYTTNPSDKANPGAFNWDFSSGQGNGGTIGSARNVSYSYQCPITRGAGATDLNGVPDSPDSNLVVCADRTPATMGGTFTGAAGSPGAWPASVGPDKWHFYNSQNHSNGEMMNVLYVDGHAAIVRVPNCGPDVTATKTPDCIFSTLAGPPAASAKDDGIDFGGAVDNTKHVGKKDSYLFGAGGK